MSNRFTYGMQPTAAMAALNQLDDDTLAREQAAAGSASAAAGSASASASSATQSATARDAAIAAWQASTAPTEQLAALSQSIHSGTVVDVFLYDTSKDSDGGAWRKRCRHTSWENEPLVPGKWLGQRVNLAAAWAVTGAAAGDFYQSTTDGKFYQIGGTVGAQTQTEVFRGNSREFPALAAIVAESGRAIIYDLTQASCPMWMVYVANVLVSWLSSTMLSSGITSAVKCNGTLYVTSSDTAGGGLTAISLVSDKAVRFEQNVNRTFKGQISSRHVTNGHSDGMAPGLVHAAAFDVASTVLTDAPLDPATGLPVPTIAVATDGGVSIIRQDGTVVNGTENNASWTVQAISFDKWNRVWGSAGDVLYGALQLFSSPPYASVGMIGGGTSGFPQIGASTGYGAAADWPYLLGGQNLESTLVGHGYPSQNGLTLIQENQGFPQKSMVAYITNAYNSGWQVGGIRGTWLSSTVAETVSGTELITNGTFSTDTTGWSAIDATLSVVAGALRVAQVGTGVTATAYQAITCVVGKTYTATMQITADAIAGNILLSIGDTAGGIQRGQVSSNDALGVFNITFVATQTTQYLAVSGTSTGTNGQSFDVDNISCRLAEPDRSVKAKGLVVSGSITKAPVATGAKLVAYSGFSTANYLEQPYNADLDFGTGDFCYLAWIKPTADGVTILERGSSPNAAGDFSFFTAASGNLEVVYQGVAVATSTLDVPLNVYSFVGYVRRGGKGYFVLNGALQNLDTGATANITSVGTRLRIGLNVPATKAFAGSIALVRASATAPSDDQIARIYRDELPLFQQNAQCTIDGTSTAVAALAYDDATELLHVGTSWGRSAFKGLLRVESEATAVGAIAALSAGEGAVITGGTSARVYQPAQRLRDELRRKDEAKRALGKEPVFFDVDAVAAQVAFPIAAGYRVKAVYAAGALKRNGSTKDYTVSFDGFKETVTFGVAPGAAAWISIMCVRSN